MKELRISPDRSGFAVKADVPAGMWFVYQDGQGGGYTSGVFEGVDTWTPIPVPEQDNREEQQ